MIALGRNHWEAEALAVEVKPGEVAAAARGIPNTFENFQEFTNSNVLFGRSDRRARPDGNQGRADVPPDYPETLS